VHATIVSDRLVLATFVSYVTYSSKYVGRLDTRPDCVVVAPLEGLVSVVVVLTLSLGVLSGMEGMIGIST
jgi:hypothetical protein